MFKIKYSLLTVTLFFILIISNVNALTIQEISDLKTGKSQPITHDNGIVIIQVWATWCAPCLKEIPLIAKWYKQHIVSQKAQIKQPIYFISVAVDTADNVNKLSKKQPISYPVWVYSGKNLNSWLKGLGNPTGGIPFTSVLAPKCQYQKAIFGAITEKVLETAVSQARQACLKK